jgi:hypothetical protein
MKLVFLISLLCSVAGFAQTIFLAPSNPPPVVEVAWVSNSYPVASYWVYWGTNTHQYTTKINAGTNFSLLVTLPLRGPTYFFAATAKGLSGLESDLSSEVTYRPDVPPPPPTLLAPIVITVQTKSPADAFWVNTDISGNVSPLETQRVYRLEIAMKPPPIPGVVPLANTRPSQPPPYPPGYLK